MNENIAKQKNNEKKRCIPKPKCCNCCMCGYICLNIFVLLIAMVITIIYGIEPALHNIVPQLKNVYIQLFDYGLGEDKWSFGSKSFSKIFLNATGAFGVEAYNPNFAGFYIHDWKLNAIALNLYQNPEQWGNTFCCAEYPKWNHTNPYIHGKENPFVFDKRQWFGSHTSINMTYVLFVNHLSEELFYIAWEASWMNDWRLNLSLQGGGWGKSDTFSVDIKILMDCNVSVNASGFFPFEPPKPLTMDMDLFDVADKDYDVDKNESIGRVPPRKYTWQKFPILDLSCEFGVGGLKFL